MLKAIFLPLIFLASALPVYAEDVKHDVAVKVSRAQSPERNMAELALKGAKAAPQYHGAQEAWVYDIHTQLSQDYDQDGYYQSLTLDIDFDSIYQSHAVYADFYLVSLAGEKTFLYSSNAFVLYGDSHNDRQRFQFQLIDTYYADLYSMEVRLYDADTHALQAHEDGVSHSSLRDLPLESQTLDQYHSVAIHDLSLTLDNDYDHNGYYESFALDVDLDSQFATQHVYLKLFMNGREIYQSSVFHIHGHDYDDKQHLDVTLVSGFYAGYYDLEVAVFDADDHRPLSRYYAADWAVLSNIPLESQHQHGGQHVEVTRSSGSLFYVLLLLSMAAMGRRWK